MHQSSAVATALFLVWDAAGVKARDRENSSGLG
jgi:hypothetical protein